MDAIDEFNRRHRTGYSPRTVSQFLLLASLRNYHPGASLRAYLLGGIDTGAFDDFSFEHFHLSLPPRQITEAPRDPDTAFLGFCKK